MRPEVEVRLEDVRRLRARVRTAGAALLGFSIGLGFSLVLGLPRKPAPSPRYLEVDVPNRVLECVQLGSGFSCNWSDPLVATSSRAIERLPDGSIVEVDPPEVEVEP